MDKSQIGAEIMSDTVKVSGGGMGFTGALTIVFIIMKLLGHISWSWWWVLAPIWIPVVFLLGVVLPVCLLGLFIVWKRG